MPDKNVNLALNSTECLRSASSFGYTEITNICTGTKTVIGWGGVDWAVAFVGFGLAFAILWLLFVMARSIFRNTF